MNKLRKSKQTSIHPSGLIIGTSFGLYIKYAVLLKERLSQSQSVNLVGGGSEARPGPEEGSQRPTAYCIVDGCSD
jgi:hypothetical protein